MRATDLYSTTAVAVSASFLPRPPIIAAAGLLFLAGGFFVPFAAASLTFMATGGILLAMTLIALIAGRVVTGSEKRTMDAVSKFIEHDASPSFVTDADGEISYRNAVAGRDFEEHPADTLSFALRNLIANPSAVIFRLKGKADIKGAAREDIVTRRGHLRLSVHLIAQESYLWRLEDLGDRGAGSKSAGGSLPMLTSGPSGTVLFMNEAFRKLMGGRVKSLDRIFRELPLQSGEVHIVDTADGPIDCIVVEIAGSGGRKEIYLLPSAKTGRSEGAEWSGIERLPVPLMKVRTTGEIVASNREARALIGGDIAEGASFGDLFQGLGRPMVDWLSSAARQNTQNNTEFLRSTANDKDTFVQVSLSAVHEDGEPCVVAVMNDVTELKTLELQFVQSQKMQAIGQLAGGVAHDFNNLLTAISGHCDLLLLRHDQGDPDYGDLVQINQNANRAASLVGQLLAFSRKQNLRPELLDLRDTLADLTHLLNRLVGEKVTLGLSHDPGLLRIRADKRQLEQVLMNLVVNARDAMPEGGEILVETENRTLEKPFKRDRAVVPVGDYVVVKVTDEGVGIPSEKLDQIFEPFYTTKRQGEGTGLGLSTAYGIVKQSGGFIFADSIPGSGTTFSLYFPVQTGVPDVEVEKPADTAVAGPPPPLNRSGEGVILLVEDEAPVRAFASRALRLRGYTVLEAESAEAALETLEDEDLSVDVFVTDVIMPGMDGPSWVREALKVRPDVRVVFVSGYAEDAFNEDQSSIPNSVFLPKPFSLSDLTLTVHNQMH